MKIIEICPRYHPYIGGIETHVKEISERLVRNGFDLEVFTTDPSGKLAREETIEGVKVRRFRSYAPKESYYISPQLYRGLINYKYDILHAHSYHASPLLIGTLARNRRKKFIATFHFCSSGFSLFRSILHIPYKLAGHYIVRSADKIVCLTEYEAELLQKKFPSCADKLVFIPHGVSFDRFKNAKSIISGNEFKILYTGRLSKEKGIDILFEAYEEVQEKIRNVKLIIIGSGPDERGYRHLSEKLALKNVTWIGNVSQESIPDYYKSADVFVLPSLKELQGISVLEAMATGLPVLASHHEGLINTIFDRQTGLFFKKGDHRDLAKKLITLRKDENMRRTLGNNAQIHIRNNFNYDTIFLKYIELFNELN